MQKRFLLSSAFTALLLASSSVALAGGPEIIPVIDYFNGLYVGGIGGLHEAAFKSSSLTLTPDDINIPTGFDGFVPEMTIMAAGSFASGDKDGYAFNGYGGVQAGIGKVFNYQWYLGIMGFGEWGSESHTSQNTSIAGGGFTVEGNAQEHLRGGFINSTTTVKIENDYGVAAKLGYLLAPRTMAYGKIGAIWANIKVSNQAVGDSNISLHIDDGDLLVTGAGVVTGSSSNTENKIAALFGGGVEQYIYKDIFSINIEYDYANFGTVKTGPTYLILNGAGSTSFGGATVASATVENQTTTSTQQAKGSAIITMLMAGLNVHFGSNWI